MNTLLLAPRYFAFFRGASAAAVAIVVATGCSTAPDAQDSSTTTEELNESSPVCTPFTASGHEIFYVGFGCTATCNAVDEMQENAAKQCSASGGGIAEQQTPTRLTTMKYRHAYRWEDVTTAKAEFCCVSPGS